MTRLAAMKDRDEGIDLPPVPADYLVEWFLEIGPTESGSMGESALTWGEIAAWEGRIGVELTPWEARTIRSMSSVYLIQRHDSKKPACPSPMFEADEVGRRDRVSDQFAAMLRAIKPTI